MLSVAVTVTKLKQTKTDNCYTKKQIAYINLHGFYIITAILIRVTDECKETQFAR